MLRSVKDLIGYKILARDGQIGDVEDFYFDDHLWIIRYITVNTGNWLPGRLVLISPVDAGVPDWSGHVFPVRLSREAVKNSPSELKDKPVSRRYETELHKYYGWPVYWGPSATGAIPGPISAPESAAAVEEDQGDPNLRSAKEVIGYHIQAVDGEIGHAQDFIADTETWTIRYVVVDTRNILPGRKVLIAPEWITSMRWDERKVHVDADSRRIRESPTFDPSTPVNREYEARLYDYYGRPAYW